MIRSPFIHEQTGSIAIPTFSTITFLDPRELNYVQAMQNYCMLYKLDGSHVFTSVSFGKVLSMLEPYGFFQCHKSYAINMHHILKYHKKGMVELHNKAEVPVARRRKGDFFTEMHESTITVHQQ